MYYAHKKFYGHVTKVEGRGVLETVNGSIPVFPGEMIFTNRYGQQEVITEHSLKKDYEAVEPMTIEEIAKGYIEMGEINLEEANEGVHTYLEGMWTDKPC